MSQTRYCSLKHCECKSSECELSRSSPSVHAIWYNLMTEIDPSAQQKKYFFFCQCHFKKDTNNKNILREPFITREQYKKAILSLHQSNEEYRHLNETLTPCQVKKLVHPNTKIVNWDDDSIHKGIQLLSYTSKNVYKFVTKVLGYPLPSLRFIQQKISSLSFQEGVIPEVLVALTKKSNETENLDMVLYIDEMSIKEGLQMNNSTNTFSGYVSQELEEPMSQDGLEEPCDIELAKKVLVFLLRDINSEEESVVAYYFTGASVTGNQMSRVVTQVIRSIESNTQFKIHGVSSDMAGANVQMWANFGVVIDKEKRFINASHPSDESRKIFFFADPSHVLKSIRNCLINQDIVLSDSFKNSNNLKSNIVSFSVLRDLIGLRGTIDSYPKLKENCINPGHFEKMNVSKAVHCFKCFPAIREMANSYKNRINYHVAISTACFFEHVMKWWDLVSNTDINSTNAIDISNFNDTNEHAIFLNSFNNCIHQLSFKSLNKSTLESETKELFKPIKRGVILFNLSSIALCKYLKCTGSSITRLRLGCFSTDNIERLFAQLRRKNPRPGSEEIRIALQKQAMAPRVGSQISTGANVQSTSTSNLLANPSDVYEARKRVRTESVNVQIPFQRYESNSLVDSIVKREIQEMESKKPYSCKDCNSFVNQLPPFMTNILGTVECNIQKHRKSLIGGTKISMFSIQMINFLELQSFNEFLPSCNHKKDILRKIVEYYINKRTQQLSNVAQPTGKYDSKSMSNK